MKKSKLINYLNKTRKKIIITEIKSAQWRGEDDDKELNLHVVMYKFHSDGNKGGGYYNRNDWEYITLKDIELKELQRNINIESLLEEDEEQFNIESKIYTSKQLKKLQELRDDKKVKMPDLITKHDYYGSIKVGDKIWYKGEAGVVTFLHKPKEDSHFRFTVNVDGVETRYVNPFSYYRDVNAINLIKKRKPIDYSDVEIPKQVKEMSTKELLKYLNFFRTKSFDYIIDDLEETHLRAELSTREHIPNKNEAKRNRSIAKKHGGSKSKSR